MRSFIRICIGAKWMNEEVGLRVGLTDEKHILMRYFIYDFFSSPTFVC